VTNHPTRRADLKNGRKSLLANMAHGKVIENICGFCARLWVVSANRHTLNRLVWPVPVAKVEAVPCSPKTSLSARTNPASAWSKSKTSSAAPRVPPLRANRAHPARAGTQNVLIASEQLRDLPKAGVVHARDSEDSPKLSSDTLALHRLLHNRGNPLDEGVPRETRRRSSLPSV
jgi:hypothetical protein